MCIRDRLQRTTRQISLTLDGAAYYPRCVRLLADLEETEAVFSAARNNPKGSLDDSLVARPMAMLDQVTCASPDYLKRFGTPQCLADLEGHQMVEYFSSSNGKRYGLEFMVNDQVQAINLPKQVSVNSADGYLAACEAGYGLVQTPYYHVARHLAHSTG